MGLKIIIVIRLNPAAKSIQENFLLKLFCDKYIQMMCTLSIRENIYSHVENKLIFIKAWTDEIKQCFKKTHTSLDSSAKLLWLLWLLCALVRKKVHLLSVAF